MEEDWDNLLILDGCRYDTFKRTYRAGGELHKRRSRGSATSEWLLNNFEGAHHPDTVYVTANPMYATTSLDGVFHDTIHVWRSEWNDQYDTVMPKKTREAAQHAAEAYPEKRLLVHFIQPHYPFIGVKGQSLEHAGIEYAYRKAIRGDGERDERTVWDRLWGGEVDRVDVREAYRENLEVVLQEVEPLVEEFDGKTVISSDHGNLLGDWILPIPHRAYGHPANFHTPALIDVPWVVIPFEERRSITADGTTERNSRDDEDIVEDRLKALGYR